MPDSADFPARLTRLRTAAGLRPADLARAAGVSRQAVHRWETGAALPSRASVLRLAAALGVRVEDLFPATDSSSC